MVFIVNKWYFVNYPKLNPKKTPAHLFTMRTVLNTWYFVDCLKTESEKDTRSPVHNAHCLEHVVFCQLAKIGPKKDTR